MGRLSKGFNTREFKFIDSDNMEQTIVLLPLKGDNLHLIFKLAGKFKDMNEQAIQEVLTESETMTDVTKLCTDTIKRSMPEEKESDIDAFVSQHIFELFPVIIELNVPKVK